MSLPAARPLAHVRSVENGRNEAKKLGEATNTFREIHQENTLILMAEFHWKICGFYWVYLLYEHVFLTGVFNCLTGDLTIYKMIQKMRISLTEHVDFMGFATDLSLSSANIVGTTI